MQDYQYLELRSKKAKTDQKVQQIISELPMLNEEDLYKVLHILHLLEKVKNKQALIQSICKILEEINDLYSLDIFVTSWETLNLKKHDGNERPL